jgi:hypothetical protein
MKLSHQEATLFFELMWPLQFFVNQRQKILPAVQTLENYIALPMEEKIKVRDVLFASKEWIDTFVKENPRDLPEDKLLMISKWRDFIKEDFYIERFLKKYAIFIGSEDRVYSVCGLYDGFDKMIHPSNLPLYVHTVLLPFAGKIIYDGVFQGYNIHFGSGISSSLKETYLIAKQKNRIIESFDAQPVKPTRSQPLKNWEPDITALYDKAKRLKAERGSPATYESAFALVKASLEYAQTVVGQADTTTLHKALRKAARTLEKAHVVLEREEM